MIRYKFEILKELKKRGYSAYALRTKKVFGERTLTDLRHGKPVLSDKNLSILCRLLDMQPGDLLEYVPDPETDQTAERLNSD
ncbi:MAG: helix-turn-helix transcriptional regulator [Dialister sp.]|uniref:helix-turn-helix domain-containing protein n=1 Tax=Dialister sp. TaxID=1955814 RepID=UPI001DB926EE|nr:helix-turn-helix transcriptional regulator [Dialister sp.]MBS6715019.1 helix-turn-helix transcriptional regulator [Dialister sp.]